ncbi:MAG: family 20 glycosylhydrolase [Lentisphaerae bacterium]|nr:family 20 glycosylhydrolase [Lentisphaerota bacterium]
MSERILAYHCDLKKAMWTPSYMAAMAERLAEWGFNAILYEVEDKFRFKNHPAIAHGDAQDHDEARGTVDMCRKHGLEVIPMMQSLGHAESVVGNPAYAHLRETPEIGDQYDPLSDEAQRLIIEFFDELIDVMQPKEYFHIGGDETRSLGKSEKCRNIVKEIGVGGLYLKHMMPLFEHLHSRGLRPVIWGDILLAHPEILDQVPPYVVIMDWDYWTDGERPKRIIVWGGHGYITAEQVEQLDAPSFNASLKSYAVDDRTSRDGSFLPFYCATALCDRGFDIMTASSCRCDGDMGGIPLLSLHVPNSYYSARKGVLCGLGNVVTTWAKRHNHPEVGLPAVFAAALGGDPDSAVAVDAVYRAYTRDFYGVEMPDFGAAVKKAEYVFSAGEAEKLRWDRETLGQGKDPLPKRIAELDEQHGGREGAIAALTGVLAGYCEARDVFLLAKEQRRRTTQTWITGLREWICTCSMRGSCSVHLTAAWMRMPPVCCRRLCRCASEPGRCSPPHTNPAG